MHPIMKDALRGAGLPVDTDPRNMLLRELATFLEDAGNILCDDCHDVMSRSAGALLRRVQRELGDG
jgi:hypothetical protein